MQYVAPGREGGGGEERGVGEWMDSGGHTMNIILPSMKALVGITTTKTTLVLGLTTSLKHLPYTRCHFSYHFWISCVL